MPPPPDAIRHNFSWTVDGPPNEDRTINSSDYHIRRLNEGVMRTNRWHLQLKEVDTSKSELRLISEDGALHFGPGIPLVWVNCNVTGDDGGKLVEQVGYILPENNQILFDDLAIALDDMVGLQVSITLVLSNLGLEPLIERCEAKKHKIKLWNKPEANENSLRAG